MQELLQVLSTVHIFRGIPPDVIAEIAEHGRLLRFPRGSGIVRQGDASESLYVILKGHARVERSHPQIIRPVLLASLGPGDVAGEMGILDNEPRSATVLAETDVEALEIPGVILGRLIVQRPDLGAALLKILSRRLRSTDDLLAKLASESEQVNQQTQ
ncbi:MAG TPA: cyclic nucleotide-binding domain-containing protein [Dehalococcoidia bacterium]|nr:cyclic nucleotide-binding domain-containing protein [Dehalococcoidia bacterium]